MTSAPLDAVVVRLMAPGRIELQEEKVPLPSAGQLLCETVLSAISPGTELAAYKGLPPLRPGVAYPRLQGYCNVARVVAVGPGVTGYVEGDRILSFTSHRSAFLIDAGDVLYTLPATARASDVVCTYLFHLGYNAVIRSGVRPGSRVLVIGLGVLGLTSVALAAYAGARVMAISDQRAAAETARAFGAEAVYGRAHQPALRQDLGPDLADVVISTTGSWTDWHIALEACAQGGTIAVLGFPGRGEPPPDQNPLASQHFYMKQLRIEAVGMSPERPDSRGFARFNERSNLAFLAGLIEQRRLDASRLVSGIVDGTQIERAYQDLLDRRSSANTYLLQWNSTTTQP